MHAISVSKGVPGFEEPVRWSGQGAKATEANTWLFKCINIVTLIFFYIENTSLKESGGLSYYTLSAISVQKLEIIILQIGTFSHTVTREYG